MTCNMVLPNWPKPVRWILAAIFSAAATGVLCWFLVRVCLFPFAAWRRSIELSQTGQDPSPQLWVMGIMMAMMPLSALLAGLISALIEGSDDLKFPVLLSGAYGIVGFAFLRRFPVLAATFAIAAFLGCYWGQRLLQRRTRRIGKSRHH